MKTETELPVLFYKAKTGAIHQWRVWNFCDQVFTEHGQVGGKLQKTPGKVCQATNVGRSNERNSVDQAAFEAQALHTHKLERKYSLTPDEAAEQLFLPMLAHPIEKVKTKNLVFPGHVQPKLDGVRCMAYWDYTGGPGGQVLLMSRSGKPYFVPHLTVRLGDMLPKDTILDGEIYVHGQSCQTVTSWVKNGAAPQRVGLVYNVYDVPQVDGRDDLPWEQRCDALHDLVGRVKNEFIEEVPYEGVQSLDEINEAQRRYVDQGYEGAMFRQLAGRYEWGRRSNDLLKVKTFQDGEFVVVGAREGEGKMAGCVVWRCKNDLTDAEFECSMACPMVERARYFREADKFVGRKLTVKFFDRTDDQLPRFPVGKLFRDEKDIG